MVIVKNSLDGNHKWTATQGMCTTNNSATPRTTPFLGGNQRHSAHRQSALSTELPGQLSRQGSKSTL